MKILRALADTGSTMSLATKTRQKNFAIFKSLYSLIPKPLKILDIGGTQQYWEILDFIKEEDVEIILLNISKSDVKYSNFISMAGDARDLTAFGDKEFDIVFSHSVIEHVGGFEDQRRMANEIKRVGKRYFLQTQNRFFPMETHFLVPMFQFFPVWLKVLLISHFDLGWFERTPDKEKATETANPIRLLNEKELRVLFPGATLYKENFLD